MAKQVDSGKKRFGCSPGCLISLIAIAVVFSIGAYFTMQPINASKRIEQDLLDRLGEAPDYVPAPDGAVAPERMEVFLSARREMLEKAGRIQATIARIEAIDEQEELSAGDFASFVKSIFNVMPHMLEFVTERNNALLAHGMGLGEYFYIFALAYCDGLSLPDDRGRPLGDNRFVTDRMTREFTQMLRNQLDNPAHSPTDEMATALRREIAALEAGEHVLPWQVDKPAPIEASLAPYRERLAPLFIMATREMELSQKNKNFGGIGD